MKGEQSPFICRASFQNLEPCLPKRIACEPPDNRIIVDDEYARTVIVFSTHEYFGRRAGSCGDKDIPASFLSA